MDISIWVVIGGLGMWLIECSYLPQIARLRRLKEANDVSVFFPALNLTGRLLAVTYSVYAGTMVLAFGFFFGVLVRTVFLSQVIYYRYLQESETPALTIVEPHLEVVHDGVLRAA